MAMNVLMQALPSDKALEWRDQAELKDLYCVYIGEVSDTTKQAYLRDALNISNDTAQSLQDLVDAGQFHLKKKEKADAFF